MGPHRFLPTSTFHNRRPIQTDTSTRPMSQNDHRAPPPFHHSAMTFSHVIHESDDSISVIEEPPPSYTVSMTSDPSHSQPLAPRWSTVPLPIILADSYPSMSGQNSHDRSVDDNRQIDPRVHPMLQAPLSHLRVDLSKPFQDIDFLSLESMHYLSHPATSPPSDCMIIACSLLPGEFDVRSQDGASISCAGVIEALIRELGREVMEAEWVVMSSRTRSRVLRHIGQFCAGGGNGGFPSIRLIDLLAQDTLFAGLSAQQGSANTYRLRTAPLQ
ncbi:hypothetical protein SISSUDRAFT_1064516 [Sistotremastrum suecicum HHB10207 ss-3]|uniref:DUF6699 domain-containing protein n=1 Tax=Sistotremastrum suecicum HHB10207 ss-3 TaxID=1314776 RepID=A0A166AKR4_9AGAM|nr:hypothetical protein SISSUDRAFT_1064516 [Sistotremastrum suecicum HHB10207 ss-3]